jgi:hypothetical protein
MTKEERRKSLYDCWQTAVNKHLGDYPIEDYANRARSEKDHWLFKLSDILHDNDYFTPKVKELVWQEYTWDDFETATNSVHAYEVNYWHSEQQWKAWVGSPIEEGDEDPEFNADSLIGSFNTKAEAKAACQKHNKESVLSLLDL